MNIRLLIGASLYLVLNNAVANIMPYAWQKSDDAIWQVRFEGQFDDQSNNLAEPGGSGTGFVPAGDVGGALFEQFSPPFSTDPDHDWGYVIGLAYIAPSHKYDLRGNYSWLSSDKSISESHPTIFYAGELSAQNSSAADFDFDFREADITLGRILKFGQTTFRFGVGLGYADIKQKAENAVTESNIVNPNSQGMPCVGVSPCLTTTGSFDNKFRGMGPKLTADGQFNFNRFIAIVGNLGVSGLYGESKANMQGVITYTKPGVSPPLQVADTHLSDDKIAVGIEGRLGLDFTPFISQDVVLDVEVGYQFTSYLNAMQEGDAFIIQDVGGNPNPGNGSLMEVLQEFDDDYFNAGLFVNIGLSYM